MRGTTLTHGFVLTFVILQNFTRNVYRVNALESNKTFTNADSFGSNLLASIHDDTRCNIKLKNRASDHDSHRIRKGLFWRNVNNRLVIYSVFTLYIVVCPHIGSSKVIERMFVKLFIFNASEIFLAYQRVHKAVALLQLPTASGMAGDFFTVWTVLSGTSSF